MHHSKLFQVLVIGSGLALAGCGDEPKASSSANNSTPTNSSQPTTQNDSTNSSDSSANSNTETPNDSTDDSSANSEELENCFCNTQPDCCEEVDGASEVVDGFVCCWGTTC